MSGQPAVERKTGSFLLGADGVRALASLGVLCGHLALRLDIDKQQPWLREVMHFVRNWGFAVSAFFVLSGVLLSLPFWRRYLEGRPAPALGTYASRRFWRLAPAFWVALLVSFAVACADELGPYPWLRLLSGLTFTSAFHYITFFPADSNGSLWSLSFEVFCYVMLPLCMAGMFAFCANHHAEGRVRGFTAGFGYWVLVLALAMALHAWILTALDPGSDGRGWQFGLIGGAKQWVPHFNVFGMYAHFVIGVLCGGWVAWRERRPGGEGAWRGANHPAYDVVAACGLAGAVAVIWAVRREPEFAFSIGSQPFAFPAFALLVALAVGALPFSTVLGRLLDNAGRYTARVSFGLYLWNELVFELVRKLIDDRFDFAGLQSFVPWMTLSAIALASVYLVAHLSYVWIEQPFLREAGSRSQGAGQAGIRRIVASLRSVIGDASKKVSGARARDRGLDRT